MKKLSSKDLLLAALFFALGVLLSVQYRAWTSSTSGPRAGADGSPAPSGEFDKNTESTGSAGNALEGLPHLPPDVPLGRDKAVAIRDRSRNLFNYASSPEEIARAKVLKRRADALAALAAEQERKRREEAELDAIRNADAVRLNPQPVDPRGLFRFIGKIGSPRAPIAVLAANDGEIYTLRVGERLGSDFLLNAIGYETLTLRYTSPRWSDRVATLHMGGASR